MFLEEATQNRHKHIYCYVNDDEGILAGDLPQGVS